MQGRKRKIDELNQEWQPEGEIKIQKTELFSETGGSEEEVLERKKVFTESQEKDLQTIIEGLTTSDELEQMLVVYQLGNLFLQEPPETKFTTEQLYKFYSKIVQANPYALQLIPIPPHGKLLQDSYKKICLKAVREHKNALQALPQFSVEGCLSKQDYKEIILYAAQVSEEALAHIQKFIQDGTLSNEDCKEIILQSSKIHIDALKFIPQFFSKPELIEFCLTAVSRSWKAITIIQPLIEEYFNQEEKKEIYLLAMQSPVTSLQVIPFPPNSPFSNEEYLALCQNVVKKFWWQLKFVPIPQKEHNFFMNLDAYKQICFAALDNDGLALQFISPVQFSQDEFRKICFKAVNKNWLAIRHIPKFLEQNFLSKIDYKELFLIAIQQNIGTLKSIPAFLENGPLSKTDYKNLYLAAVKKDGLALKYIPPFSNEGFLSAEDYKEIYFLAVSQNGLALEYILKFAKNKILSQEDYKKLYLIALQNEPLSIKFIPIPPNGPFNKIEYKIICLNAVQTRGMALEHVPMSQNESNVLSEADYKEICKAAIAKDWVALKFITNPTEDYKELYFAGVLRHGMALQFVPIPINATSLFTQAEYKEICLKAIERDWMSFLYIPVPNSDEWPLSKRDYKEICSALVSQHGMAVQYIPSVLNGSLLSKQDYKEIYLQAVKNHGMALKFIPIPKKEDAILCEADFVEICLAAVKNNKKVLQIVAGLRGQISDESYQKIYFAAQNSVKPIAAKFFHVFSDEANQKNLLAARAAINYARDCIQNTTTLPGFSMDQLHNCDAKILELRNGKMSQQKEFEQLFSVPYNNDYLKRIRIFAGENVGNCQEYAYFVLHFLRKQNIPAEIFYIRNDDHWFVVIDRAWDSDPNKPETWGKDAVVCDAWANDCYKACDIYNKLKCHGRNNQHEQNPNFFYSFTHKNTLCVEYAISNKIDLIYQTQLIQEVIDKLNLIMKIVGRNVISKDALIHKQLFHLKTLAAETPTNKQLTNNDIERMLNKLLRQTLKLINNLDHENQVKIKKELRREIQKYHDEKLLTIQNSVRTFS